jgi:hypothetical protein
MSKENFEKGPHIPTDDRALVRLRRAIEFGELDDLTHIPVPFCPPRYLVTYMNSQVGDDSMRSATVVSVTNQSAATNLVCVSFYRGFSDDSPPADGVASFSIPPQFTVDFATRSLPGELTVTNAVPNPELTIHEGRAVVASPRPENAVSARVYYTAGDGDERLHANTDTKVFVYGAGNSGD